MTMATELLDILVCPASKKPLLHFPAEGDAPEFLFCAESRLRYRIDDGVPVMLVDEAVRLSDAEVAKLVSRSR
jgi:uncharacterized protein YbaR (Trm112 family)